MFMLATTWFFQQRSLQNGDAHRGRQIPRLARLAPGEPTLKMPGLIPLPPPPKKRKPGQRKHQKKFQQSPGSTASSTQSTTLELCSSNRYNKRVSVLVELADTRVLGARIERCVGSSPTDGTFIHSLLHIRTTFGSDGSESIATLRAT